MARRNGKAATATIHTSKPPRPNAAARARRRHARPASAHRGRRRQTREAEGERTMSTRGEKKKHAAVSAGSSSPCDGHRRLCQLTCATSRSSRAHRPGAAATATADRPCDRRNDGERWTTRPQRRRTARAADKLRDRNAQLADRLRARAAVSRRSRRISATSPAAQEATGAAAIAQRMAEAAGAERKQGRAPTSLAAEPRNRPTAGYGEKTAKIEAR